MKIVFNLFLLLFFFSAQAQELLKTIPGKMGTSNIEGDGRLWTCKINESDFLVLSKLKGGLTGSSSFQLTKYKLDLDEVYSTSILLNEFEEICFITCKNNQVQVWVNEHEELKHQAILKVKLYQLENGEFLEEKKCMEHQVQTFLNDVSNGKAAEHFQDMVNNSQSRGYVTPFEYQYYFSFSPDSSKLLTYIYDFHEKPLKTKIKILNTETFEVLQEGSIPIDNKFVNYGLYLNNKSEVYILNVNESSRVALVKFNVETKENVFMDISSSLLKRYDFHVQIFNDDQVYVFNLAASNEALKGLMITKFDFKEQVIARINDYALSSEMQQNFELLLKHSDYAVMKEDWRHYYISSVYLNEYEKVIMVLEKKYIESPVFQYPTLSTMHPDHCFEKIGRVFSGPLLMFSFNALDEIMWETILLKYQSNDITQGNISIGYHAHLTEEGQLKIVYPYAVSASGISTKINYSVYDVLNGSRLKSLELTNEEQLTLMTPWTSWTNDALYLYARKGILGKKNYLLKYRF
jgi:hypothetical protein